MFIYKYNVHLMAVICLNFYIPVDTIVTLVELHKTGKTCNGNQDNSYFKPFQT